MLYIFWAVLNVGLLIYFLYLIMLVCNVLGKKIGRFPAIFFVLALFSFVCSPGHHDNDKSGEAEKWHFTAKDSLEKNSVVMIDPVYISTTPISKYYVGGTYGHDKVSKENVPVEAYAGSSGWQLGTRWRANYVDLSPTGDNKKFKYTVNATTEWYLLGFPLWTESKDYNGIILLK